MNKETLLRLLLLHVELETAEAWAAALPGGEEKEASAGVLAHGGEEEGERVPLIVAMDEVVPYLPDYRAVSTKLKALMSCAKEAYSNQVNRLVQGWLQCGGHSVQFRRWVIHDWLKCSYLTSVDPAALLQWRHALFVAANNETIKPLKRTLLQVLNAVNETIETHFEDDESGDGTTKTPDAALQSIETVEELLDFCFLHAEQLASCSLLCAAKLHALAVQTQRSAVKLAECEKVLVRLRWSLMLKPVLFKAVLQHAITMKTISGKITTNQLWTSDEVESLVGLVDVSSRDKILVEMRASKDELERAFASGAEHIYGSPTQTKDRSVVEAAVGGYFQSLSIEKRKLLLAELEQDLDEAPPHIFLYVFMFFGLILSATLSPQNPEDQDLLAVAVNILFALFDRRSHDVESCLDVLGLLLRKSLAANPIWLDNLPLYLEAIESQIETVTLQSERKLKWIAKMAMHQLLFECDVQVLQRNQCNLFKLLPPRTMQLVSIRLNN